MRRLLVIAVTLCGILIMPAGPIRAQPDDDFSVRDGDRKQKILQRVIKLLERRPWNDYTFKQLQKHAPAAGGVDGVIERYLQQVAEDPANQTALILLSRLYHAGGEWELALRYLDELEKQGFSGWELYRLRGATHAELGDQAAAEDDFETALKLASNNADKMDVLRELGDAARRDGRQQEAVEIYNRIAKLAPRDRYLRWELANLFYELAEAEPERMDLWQASVEQFRAAAELAGRNVEERSRAELEIASIYTRYMGRHDDAIAIYDQILDRTSDKNWMNREVRVLLEEAYRQKGDLEGLLARLDKALDRRRNDPWALELRPRVLAELGRGDQALEAWELYFDRIDEPGEDAFGQYVRLLQKKGDQPGILAAYEERIDAERDEARKVILLRELVSTLRMGAATPLEAYSTLRRYEEEFDETASLLELARAYQSLGPHEDVLARARYLISRVIERNPENMDAWLALLEIAVEERNEVEEESILIDIFALESFDPATLKALVAFYEERAQTDQVQELLQRGVKRWPRDMDLRFLRAQYGEGGTADQQMSIWRDVLLQSDNSEHIETAALYYSDLVDRFAIREDVVEKLERDYARSPSDWRRGRLLYFMYVDQGRLEDAEILASSLSAWIPPGISLEELALPLLEDEQGRFGDALYMLQSMARKKPQRSWRYTLQAADLMLIHNKDQQEIAELVEKAVNAAPQNPECLFLAGDIYNRLNRTGDAEAMLEQALALSPQSNRIRLAYAEVLYERWQEVGELPLLLTGYEAALEGLPTAQDPTTADEMLQIIQQMAATGEISHTKLRNDLEKAAKATVRADVADVIRLHIQRLPDHFAVPVW